ncbi:MAG: SH3 domain-containing protein [Anaerolineae bacterium]
MRFILLGDSQINNDVPPDVSNQSVEPIDVQITTSSNIRSGPTRNANVVRSEPAGTVLQADGLSADGQWVRVAIEGNSIGWIFRDLIRSDGDIDGLPVQGEQPLTPMQAFHLQTNLGDLQCNQAPSALVVQGPKQTKIQIKANGVDIQLGSTIVLQTIDQKTFKLATIDGLATVDGLNIPAGYKTEAELDENGDVSGRFGRVLPLTKEELELLQVLEDISPDVLNYPIKVQDRVSTPAPRPTAAPQSQSPTAAAPSGDVSCDGFKPTSPLDGLKYGLNTFYWDPAPGATSYRLTVVGVGSTDVSAPTTTTNFDLYNAGQNFQMSWYVEALVNGQVSCTSQTVTIPREANPPQFSASWQCGPGDRQVTVSYQYAPPGSNSVTINIPRLEVSDTRPFPPYTGSATYNDFFGGNGSVVANPSGATIGLPDIFCGQQTG